LHKPLNRIWYPGRLLKLRNLLPPSYFLFFKSYLENRTYATRVGNELSPIYPIDAGVPQKAISSPKLFNIYTSDQPTSPNTYVADYGDEKIIVAINESHEIASFHLQSHLNHTHNWFDKWCVKLNETKSSHTTFTL